MTKDAIISRLHGGLGNQMFQYAVGRALALKHDCPLLLDMRYFDDPVPYGFGLDHFSAAYRIAKTDELPPSRRSSQFRYAAWRLFKSRPHLVREQGLGFNEDVLSRTAPAYLHGYWQCERYFAEYADFIRADLTVSPEPSTSNRNYLAEITSASAVSLHVRRGDYASDPAIRAAHGLCSPEYYQKAVEFVADQTVIGPRIYIFSDDPDWAEQNLSFPFETTIIRGNSSETAFEDLRLMSACDHHIIANSSFSWWGAWLNPSPDKIVVAPKRWFAHPQMSNPDIVPDKWVRL